MSKGLSHTLHSISLNHGVSVSQCFHLANLPKFMAKYSSYSKIHKSTEKANISKSSFEKIIVKGIYLIRFHIFIHAKKK